MKKVFIPILVIAVLLSAVAIPNHGQAISELDKIENELKLIQKQQAKAKNDKKFAEAQINKIHGDISKAEKEIDAIQAQIDLTTKELVLIERQVEIITEELRLAGEQLAQATERVASRDSLLKTRIHLMYTNGIVDYIDVILSSTSFNDFLDRYHVLTSIVSQDKDLLEANKKDKEIITVQRKQINDNLYAEKQFKAKKEAAKQNLLVNEKDKKVLIASLNSQEKHYEEITEEQEKLLINAASKASALINKKNKIISEYQTGGAFVWPAKGQYRITSSFGTRTDPVTGKKGASHNGTDIGAPAGTDILAAVGGVVIVAQWWGGYGNCVIIDHGKGMWTLYGHIRNNGIKVKVGDAVKAGQKIAEVGSTGKSTGNHLHFEVRINEKPVDAMKYLKGK